MMHHVHMSCTTLLHGGAGMQNHTECCRRYSVPPNCYSLCSGQVRDLRLDQLDCLSHLDVLGSCIVEGQGMSCCMLHRRGPG